MKKRVNLLISAKHKALSEELISRIRLGGTIIGVVLFLVFLVTIILQVLLFQNENKLLSQKRDLLQYIVDNKQYETKFAFFNYKSNLLKKDLLDDAEFLPYYNLLNTLLQTSSEGATLESMSIDKSKVTNFSIKFNGLDPAYRFIRYLESESFLNNFTSLTLNSFSLLQSESVIVKNYQLSFTGKFKVLNANGKPN